MKRLLLYTTAGCHLCETAEQLMRPALTTRGYELERVEISASEQLMARYGTRIPVIRRPERQDELDWPFSELEFLDYIADAGAREQ